MVNYLDASEESGKEFYRRFHNKGRIVLLNLLKFKEIADYTSHGNIKPTVEITGEEAYRLYLESTIPELEKVGSRILYYGKSGRFLIGPQHPKWDAILLVEHASVTKFMEFSQSKGYLKNAGHRTAALEDSRLLPSTEIKDFYNPKETV